MLEHYGFLQRSPGGRAYRSGEALLALGLSAVNNLDIRARARPFMESLRDRVDDKYHPEVPRERGSRRRHCHRAQRGRVYVLGRPKRWHLPACRCRSDGAGQQFDQWSLGQNRSRDRAARTLTGTANEITISNGDGVSGAPTFSLPAALTFTGKTITGGTYSFLTISGAVTITAPATVSASWMFDGPPTSRLVDAGAGAGPLFSTFRDSATPAANDLIGFTASSAGTARPTSKNMPEYKARSLIRRARVRTDNSRFRLLSQVRSLAASTSHKVRGSAAQRALTRVLAHSTLPATSTTTTRHPLARAATFAQSLRQSLAAWALLEVSRSPPAACRSLAARTSIPSI